MAVPGRIERVAYRAQHLSVLAQCLAAHRLVRMMTRRRLTPPRDALEAFRRRYEALLARDLANVEHGEYPQQLLSLPLADYAQRVPSLLRDLPRAARRMRAGNYRDLPRDVDTRRYPPYFRRNFHWQTDGYFSRRSAELYDVGVELLFLGMADVMRRQVIPPVRHFLEAEHGAGGRLLDVACGTGRTLYQLAAALPDLHMYGVDLSPYYLQVAREVLAHVPDVSLVAENAEDMPFRDGFFDVVTSVYLCHELPRNARHNVLREMHRVLRPGGLLVLMDSCQVSESAPMAFFLDSFSRDFHEPFYADYVRDDLETALRESGFEIDRVETHFVSKAVIARRPAAAGQRPIRA